MASEKTINNQLTQEKNESIIDNSLLENKLSNLGLGTDLYLSLNYHHIKIPKSGLIAKFKKQKEALDIDLACILFDKHGKQLELVWYKNLRDSSEAIIHYGDELKGFRQPKKSENKNKTNHEQEETSKKNKVETADIDLSLSPVDLESIHISLPKLDHQVHHVALIASSFQNSPLCKVPVGQIDLEDEEGNTALQINLTHLAKDCTTLWLASLTRTNEFFFRNDKKHQDWLFIKQEKPLSHGRLEELVQYIQL